MQLQSYSHLYTRKFFKGGESCLHGKQYEGYRLERMLNVDLTCNVCANKTHDLINTRKSTFWNFDLYQKIVKIVIIFLACVLLA